MANILYSEKPIISLIFMIILSLQFDDVNTILLFFYAADGKKGCIGAEFRYSRR